MTNRSFLIAAVATCAIATPALALPCPEIIGHGPQVACGTDYFRTLSASADLTAFGLGVVPLMGLPIAPAMFGTTDTIVQRTNDIPITVVPPVAGPLMMTALQLESVNPVGRIFISLDPANLANDTGTMTISPLTGQTPAEALTNGGFLTSTLNVFFDICTQPGDLGVGCGGGILLGTGNYTLAGTGEWLPTPGPDAFILMNPDDGSPQDQAANMHTGLDAMEVDLFATIVELFPPPPASPLAIHVVSGAVVPSLPEPGSLLLIATGLLGLAGLRYRRRQH